MNIQFAYQILYTIALLVFAVLIAFMVVRSVKGPRITDRILSINMIGTMVICCIAILSRLLDEGYLTDVAIIYAMISFVTVLIFAMIYIPAKPGRTEYFSGRERKTAELEERYRKEEQEQRIRLRGLKGEAEETSEVSGGKEEA